MFILPKILCIPQRKWSDLICRRNLSGNRGESTTQVSIYEVVPTKEEGVDGLLGVTPDQTNIIFEVFKERNKDKFNFVEE